MVLSIPNRNVRKIFAIPFGVIIIVMEEHKFKTMQCPHVGYVAKLRYVTKYGKRMQSSFRF